MSAVPRSHAVHNLTVSRQSPDAKAIVRAGAILVTAAALAGLVVSSSAGTLLRRVSPESAHRYAPFDARAAATLSEQLMQSGGAEARGRAVGLARAALRRDPTVAGAWRTLALSAAGSGKAREATALMLFSEALSRRDLATQLWLIEDSVRRDNIVETLRHYDHALRTNRSSQNLLFPALVAATGRPALTESIAALVASNPPWVKEFLYVFGQGAPNASSTAQFLESVRRRGYAGAMPNANDIPARLAAIGDYRSARRAYDAIQRGSSDIVAADDPFAKSPKLPPFDWDLASTQNMRAEPHLLDAGDRTTALAVFASGGQSGVAASRLVTMRPGSYLLSIATRSQGAPLPDAVTLTVTCAPSQGVLMSTPVAPRAVGWRTVSARFDVPGTGCAAQWLRLNVQAAEGFAPTEFWMEPLRLSPAR